jgi:hypothetical protein
MRGACLFASVLAMGLQLAVAMPSRAQSSERAVPACTKAAVPNNHLFVALTGYRGDTLTNIEIGRGTDPTTIVQVMVAPGDEPITIFAIAYSGVVWEFVGDVQRVQRVFAFSTNPDRRVGVKGLPFERIEFPRDGTCLSKLPDRADNIKDLSRALRFMYGREPNRVGYGYTARAHAFAVPDTGLIESKPDGDPNRSHELYRFYPGGYRELDAATVAAPHAVTVPETPPDIAGLIQLEALGAIRAPRAEEVAALAEGASRPYATLSPNYRMRVQIDYVITRDITLPSGLAAYNKKFLVLPGVPSPRGHPGNSCIAYMDGFRVSDESLCFSEERETIRRLHALPSNEACKLLDVPADAAVEAVSAYEPDGAIHSAGSKRLPVPIAVRVRRPGKIVLVLTTYEPAIWRVSSSSQTQIVGVVLGGYYKSGVDGIQPDTPIIAVDHETVSRRPEIAPPCRAFHGYVTSGYREGPDRMLLDRQVQALTGRNIDRARGDYKIRDVEIP